MEPCTRKRTLPRTVTEKKGKQARQSSTVVPPPLPTPDPQEGDVEFGPMCEWYTSLEHEIELRMKTMPITIPERTLVVNPKVAVRMNHKGKVAGDIELLERESDEETIVDESQNQEKFYNLA